GFRARHCADLDVCRDSSALWTRAAHCKLYGDSILAAGAHLQRRIQTDGRHVPGLVVDVRVYRAGELPDCNLGWGGALLRGDGCGVEFRGATPVVHSVWASSFRFSALRS